VPAGETKQQPNGDFTIFLGLSQGWQPTYGRYVEFMPSGEIVRSYAASPPFYTDNHEILLSGIGDTVATVHLFGYELRQVDLSARGGPVDALVAGHVIVRQSVTGQVEFLWNAWDHFVLADWIEPTGVNPPLDFDHPNSLDFDVDGSYVVSFRHMGEITKIDRRTGTIVWRLGGRNNQFMFFNDPLGGSAANIASEFSRMGICSCTTMACDTRRPRAARSNTAWMPGRRPRRWCGSTGAPLRSSPPFWDLSSE